MSYQVRSRRRGAVVGSIVGLAFAVTLMAVPVNATVSTRVDIPNQVVESEPSFAWVGSGVINADVTPGESDQSFEFTITNEGRIAGQVAMYPLDGNVDDFSDAVLDNTRVRVIFGGHQNHNREATVTLREFLTTAFVPGGANFTLTKDQTMPVRIIFTPPADISGFDADDLGTFSSTFTMGVMASATTGDISPLFAYATSEGKFIGASDWEGLWTIPVSEVETAVESGLSANG